MKILYLSFLASSAVIEKEVTDKTPISYAAQKFNRLIVNGLAQNGNYVTALSTFYTPGKVFKRRKEIENNVNYCYVYSPRNTVLRYIWVIVYCFAYVLFWGIRNKREKVLMADVLNISGCVGAIAAARLIRLKSVGIMTDMPGLMVDRSQQLKQTNHRLTSYFTKINIGFLSFFTHYVFLTERMNDVVNKKKRPYIVMEGLVDSNMIKAERISGEGKRIILYAGGLHERYGLKILVEAFIKADIKDTELWIYGSGPFAEQLSYYNKLNPRVVFKGLRPNAEVVEAELKSTLLVNPRPTNEDYTQFSFPSKNLEYMVSGTPLLTTQLPGMPKEYYPYVFLFDQGETIDGYANVLNKVLGFTEEELRAKGTSARKWVLTNKNHLLQTEKIIKLVSRGSN